MALYKIQKFQTYSQGPVHSRFINNYQDARKIAYSMVQDGGWQKVLLMNTQGKTTLKGTAMYYPTKNNVKSCLWESQSGKTYRYLKRDGSFGKIVKEMM